jgi:hypothetical protein
MPENTDPTLVVDKVLTPADDVTKQNEENIRKLQEQGRDLDKPASADDFKSVSEGLDALAEQIQKKKDEEIDPPPVKKDDKPPELDEAAKKKADDEKAAKDAERKTYEDKAEEYFKDSPKLPPNASPKSAESFREIKIRAAQEIAAREADLEKLKKEIADRDEKLKNPVPPEVEKEIKDLREWKAKLDVESDPKFKEFDKTADTTRDFIYDQLRKSPNINADKIIEKVKSLGGPEMVDWTKIFEGMKDPTLQRIIESSIAEIEKAKFLKSEAIKTSKKNIEQYIAERQNQTEKSATERSTATKAKVTELFGKFDYLREKPLDPKADDATKKQIEAHNKWVAETNASIDEAIKDDSPEMKALTILGMAQLLYLQPRYDATVARLVESEKKLKEATESLAKFKNVSVNRIREGGAPTDGRTPQPKQDEGKLFTTPATQALDDLARGIMEKRAAAGR